MHTFDSYDKKNEICRLKQFKYKLSNFSNVLKIMYNKLIKEERYFITKGSGWIVELIDLL